MEEERSVCQEGRNRPTILDLWRVIGYGSQTAPETGAIPGTYTREVPHDPSQLG